MPATHHRDFLHQLRVLLDFIEFNILICILMERQRRTHLNPVPSPDIQPPASAPASPQENTKVTRPLGHALDPSKTRKGMLQQPPSRPHTHRHPIIPEFCLDAPCLFYLIEECIHHRIKKPVTNFWKPLKLAITLKHMATGETYTSLQYHWLVGRTTICKIVPQVC